MEQNKFRCHASIIIENLGGAFWFVVLMLFSSFDDVTELFTLFADGKITFFQALAGSGVILGIILLILLYNFVVWRKTWISIDNEAIVIEKNLLNRKVNTIGMKNISNINMEQNIFERIVGTYKIKLDTNSATTADQTDVKIVLSKEKAEWFKQQVMQRMNEETEENVADVQEYDVEYKAKDIIMHCVYTANPIAVIICITFIIGCAIALSCVNTGTVLLDGIVNVLGSVLAVVVVLWSVIQSLIRDFFVYYGFKAKRHENKIYLSHGLLKKRQYTIAVDKINAVKIEAPVVSRILGRQFVKVICIGVGDEENENSMLLLSEKTVDMEKKLAVLLPEFLIPRPNVIPREKNSMWGPWVAYGFCVVIWVAIAVAFGIVNVLQIENMWIRAAIIAGAILILIMVALSTWFNYKTCGIGLEEDNLLIIMGSFHKSSIWIPYTKIQELQYSQGPIARRFGYASGMVSILASMLESFHATSCFKIEVFDAIREQMLQRKGKHHVR